MPEIVSSAALPWRDAGTLAASAGLPWRDAALITSTGGMFYLPDPLPGGTPTRRGLDPLYRLPAADEYAAVHTIAVRDAETGAPIEVESLALGYDDGSVCWTLDATGPAQMFDAVAGVVPPVWEVEIDGLLWRFVIESGGRQRGEFGRGAVSVSGRSVTMLAAEPYAPAQTWLNDGPATAAQLVDQAFADTGATVLWLLDDWLVPDRVWSFTGAPMDVARRVADAAGADVRSDRDEATVRIEPRYRHLPEAWPAQPPDVEIHAEAIFADRFDRADRPAWDAVYVAGQQQGVVGYVRRAGAVGEMEGPYTTDVLITDQDAARQRGVSILGSAGPQARVSLTLPVIVGGDRPGVLEPGMSCRVIERGAPVWWGVVRSVRVEASLPSVVQTVTLERHMIESLTGDPDVWTLRSETAEIQYISRYRERFPSLIGLGATFEPIGIGPEYAGFRGTLSEDGKTVSFSNPPLGFPAEFGESNIRFIEKVGGVYYSLDGTLRAVEFVLTGTGGRRDACVGVAGAGYTPILHEVGVTDPHNQFGMRAHSRALAVGDVVGLVLGVVPAGDYGAPNPWLAVYVNGDFLFDFHDPSWWVSAANHFFVGRLDPRDFPEGYRGGR